MDKTKQMAKECIVLSMDKIKKSIYELCQNGDGINIEKMCNSMLALSLAYKNIK